MLVLLLLALLEAADDFYDANACYDACYDALFPILGSNYKLIIITRAKVASASSKS